MKSLTLHKKSNNKKKLILILIVILFWNLSSSPHINTSNNKSRKWYQLKVIETHQKIMVISNSHCRDSRNKSITTMTKKTHPLLLLRNKPSCHNKSKDQTSTSTHHHSTRQQREEDHPQLKAHNHKLSKLNSQPSKWRIDPVNWFIFHFV